MRNRPFLTATALLAASLLLPACQSGVKGGQKTDAFAAPSREMVYEVSLRSLRDQGFTPDSESSSPEQGIITTRWTQSLQPFSHFGYRDMATVWIREEAAQPKNFTVEVQVQRQRNDNQVQPGNPVAADWTGSERVEELERIIVARIKSYFVPGRVSDAFKSRYGSS